MFLFHDGRARAEKALKQNFKANDMKKLLWCQMSSFKVAREMLLLINHDMKVVNDKEFFCCCMTTPLEFSNLITKIMRDLI